MLINRNPILNDLGLLLLRLIVGVVFMFHGAQKLFGWFDGSGIEGFAGMLEGMGIPSPEIMAWLAAIAEFGGGSLIFLGLLTRLAAIGPLIVMAVAITQVHANAFSLQAEPPGMEYALTLGVVLLAIILAGPGRFSVDGFISGVCCSSRPADRSNPHTTEPPPV